MADKASQEFYLNWMGEFLCVCVSRVLCVVAADSLVTRTDCGWNVHGCGGTGSEHKAPAAREQLCKKNDGAASPGNSSSLHEDKNDGAIQLGERENRTHTKTRTCNTYKSSTGSC
jgi:hypothetical protein